MESSSRPTTAASTTSCSLPTTSSRVPLTLSTRSTLSTMPLLLSICTSTTSRPFRSDPLALNTSLSASASPIKASTFSSGSTAPAPTSPRTLVHRTPTFVRSSSWERSLLPFSRPSALLERTRTLPRRLAARPARPTPLAAPATQSASPVTSPSTASTRPASALIDSSAPSMTLSPSTLTALVAPSSRNSSPSIPRSALASTLVITTMNRPPALTALLASTALVMSASLARSALSTTLTLRRASRPPRALLPSLSSPSSPTPRLNSLPTFLSAATATATLRDGDSVERTLTLVLTELARLTLSSHSPPTLWEKESCLSCITLTEMACLDCSCTATDNPSTLSTTLTLSSVDQTASSRMSACPWKLVTPTSPGTSTRNPNLRVTPSLRASSSLASTMAVPPSKSAALLASSPTPRVPLAALSVLLVPTALPPAALLASLAPMVTFLRTLDLRSALPAAISPQATRTTLTVSPLALTPTTIASTISTLSLPRLVLSPSPTEL
mmetsp:Transcript_17461/g.28946  ORF Transcript_17461/g.28946 Transcript_17461/m.28946 type:complete len:500 (-) Transcript_17461:697-2196(-)